MEVMTVDGVACDAQDQQGQGVRVGKGANTLRRGPQQPHPKFDDWFIGEVSQE